MGENADVKRIDGSSVTVRLDRVTVTGEMTVDQELAKRIIGQGFRPFLVDGLEGYKLVRPFGNDSDEFETVAVFLPNQYRPKNWRLDTSNHLTADEVAIISDLLKPMVNRHLTRVDVAFDFKNGPVEPMRHRIFRPRATQAELGVYRDGTFRIDTVYSGKRSSDRMIRMYNKRVERIKHQSGLKRRGIEVEQTLPDRWERWEVQLRGKKSSEWLEQAREMLSYIKLPVVGSASELSPTTKAMLHALSDGTLAFGDIGQRARAKYRKLIKENVGFDTSYAQAALAVLERNMDKIERELSVFLGEVG